MASTMPDAPATDIEQGLTQRPHATACQTRAPTASPTWPTHSSCLPSEQGTTATDKHLPAYEQSRCATHPSNRPCCNQIHSHNPKSPKSDANPPSTSKNPPPKSPSIKQQMRQTSDQGRKATNAGTSRALPMADEEGATDSVRGRPRTETGQGGVARSTLESPRRRQKQGEQAPNTQVPPELWQWQTTPSNRIREEATRRDGAWRSGEVASRIASLGRRASEVRRRWGNKTS